jgi:hypothetical protein
MIPQRSPPAARTCEELYDLRRDAEGVPYNRGRAEGTARRIRQRRVRSYALGTSEAVRQRYNEISQHGPGGYRDLPPARRRLACREPLFPRAKVLVSSGPSAVVRRNGSHLRKRGRSLAYDGDHLGRSGCFAGPATRRGWPRWSSTAVCFEDAAVMGFACIF